MYVKVSISKSQEQLHEDKQKDVDDLVVAKSLLEQQLASLTETMRDREGELKMQVCVS